MILFSLDILAIKPNFVVGDIVSRFYTFIVGLLLKLLGMAEVFLIKSYQLP